MYSILSASKLKTSAVVFLLFYLFFLCTLANNFSAPHDAIDYLNEFERGKNLFNPHHVLYHITTFWLLNFFKTILPNIPHHYIVEAIDGFWGTLGLVVVFNFLRNRFGTDKITAFIGTCLPAFSFGMWFYSTNIEVYMPPLFFLLLGLYTLTSTPLTKDKIYLVIVFHVLAILFHQVNILFTPIVLWAIWKNRKEVAPIPLIFKYAVLGGGAVLLTYAIIGRFVLNYHTIGEIVYWMKGYTNSSSYWYPVGLSTLFDAVVGASHAFIGAHFIFKVSFIEDFLNRKFFYHNLTDELYLVRFLSHATALVLLVLSGLLFLMVVVLLIMLIKKWKAVKLNYGPIVTPLLLFIGIYSLFFYFWDPENLEFWIPQSVVFWLLLVGGYTAIQLPYRLNKNMVFGSLAVLLLFINFNGSIKWLRNFNNDLFYVKVVPVKDVATKNDLILVEDPWILSSYLELFTKADVKTIPEKDSVNQRRCVDSLIAQSLNAKNKVYLYREKTYAHGIHNETFVDSLLNAGHQQDSIVSKNGNILVLQAK